MATGFIFDIDGTIIDSMPFHERSWEVFLTRRGVATAREDFFRRTAGRTGVEVMRELFGPLSDADAHAMVREKEAIYRELFAPEFREIAGFTAFARAAKAAGVRIACATAGDPDNIAFAVAGLRLHDFFDAAVGAHDVARGKPEPDLFLLAAARIGVEPEQLPGVRGCAARNRRRPARGDARRRDRLEHSRRRARRARPRRRAGGRLHDARSPRPRRTPFRLTTPPEPTAPWKTPVRHPPLPPTKTRSSPSAGRSSRRCARRASRSRTTSAATRSPRTSTRSTARRPTRSWSRWASGSRSPAG